MLRDQDISDDHRMTSTRASPGTHSRSTIGQPRGPGIDSPQPVGLSVSRPRPLFLVVRPATRTLERWTAPTKRRSAAGQTLPEPPAASLAAVLLADLTNAVAELDPDLVNACGERPSWFCESSFSLTHNRMLAKAADWIVARPLTALLVLLVAWLVNRYVRKAVTAFVTRLSTSREIASEALHRIGVDRPARATVVDTRQQARAATLAAVSRASVSWFIWSIAVLVVLGLFHINLGPLLAGAGIAGIAVGFGAQALVKDCISGFFMLLEDQCGVGDEVDLGEAAGTVESITLRMTSVRGADGTLWSVPNGVIQRVGNRTRGWSQGLVDVTVWHDGDIDDALAAVREGIAAAVELPAVDEVLLQPPVVLGVERVDAGGTVLRVTVRTEPGKQWAAMREVRLAIHRALVQHDISLHPPAPTVRPPVT
jgi:moderate conductance mechanosensitive channel